MKKLILSLTLLLSVIITNAQNDNYRDEEPTGFRKDHVFLGGSISLGFGSGSFGVGANPEVGYSFSQWLDGGVVFNINYNSQRLYDLSESGYIYAGKASSFNYGAGAFLRAYPIPFLFVQLQPEENWIDYTTKDPYGYKFKQNVNAASLIGGVGYTQRVIGQGSYFLMIGMDLLTDQNSPYRDGYNHAIPIIRGGFDVYLHASRKPKPEGHVL